MIVSCRKIVYSHHFYAIPLPASMKEIVLRIEDSAYEKFMGIVDICPDVTVWHTGDCIDIKDVVDHCFACAIKEMVDDNAFKSPSDYTYIMQVVLEDNLKCGTLFINPDEFISYLKILGVEKLPSRSSLYRIGDTILGTYPNWTFTDQPNHFEELRRRNIARLFLSAFYRCKRQQ